MVRFAIAIAGLLFAAPAVAQTFNPRDESPEEFAAGAGRDETFYACTACHGFKLVAQQGLTRAGWEDSINLMIRRHNMPPLDDKDRALVLGYLEAAYPPRAPAAPRRLAESVQQAMIEHDPEKWEPVSTICARAQSRIARGVDPVGAFRGRGKEHAALAAEGALEFGAREQRGELRLAAGREQAEAIERAGDHAAIDQLGARIAEPAADFETRLLEVARKAQAAARAAGRSVSEGLDQHRAEFGVDRSRRGGSARQAQFRNARGDVFGFMVETRTVDLRARP